MGVIVVSFEMGVGCETGGIYAIWGYHFSQSKQPEVGGMSLTFHIDRGMFLNGETGGGD